jgi:hypothetical protein
MEAFKVILSSDTAVNGKFLIKLPKTFTSNRVNVRLDTFNPVLPINTTTGGRVRVSLVGAMDSYTYDSKTQGTHSILTIASLPQLPQLPPQPGLKSNSVSISHSKYGNGVYTATASTERAYPSSNPILGFAHNAFDINANTSWFSADTGTTFGYSNSFTMSNFVTVDASGAEYPGEYVQLVSPVSMSLKRYDVTSTEQAVLRSPRNWYLLGASGNNAFNLVASEVEQSNWGASEMRSFSNVQNSQAFNKWRYVVSRTNGTHQSTMLGGLRFFGDIPNYQEKTHFVSESEIAVVNKAMFDSPIAIRLESDDIDTSLIADWTIGLTIF